MVDSSRCFRLCSSGGRRLSALAGLTFGVDDELVGLFFGFEEGFLLAVFRFALGVLDDAAGLFLGAPDGFCGDAFAVGDPDREDQHGRDERS